MSSEIVGSAIASGQKVLRKSQRATEVDGLVTLTETYTIRTADIGTLEPDRNTLHSAFSSATTKYARMAVETTRVEPLDGDLSSLVVNYVGLDYATGLPSAFVTAVGRGGAGIFGADAVIVAKYLTQDSLFDVLKGGFVQLQLGASNLTLPTKRLMPSSINGTAMPPNPRNREYKRTDVVGAATTTGPNNSNVFFSGNIVQYPPEYEWLYAGYVQTSISFQRRGLFNQIEEEFSEYFNGSSVFYNASGIIDLKRVNQFMGQKTTNILF